MGIYISEKRVVIDGRLAAFEGEAMTEEEAVRRGLLDKAQVQADEQDEEPETEEVEETPAEAEIALADMTVKQLREVAEDEGIEVPPKATKEQLIKIIEEA